MATRSKKRRIRRQRLERHNAVAAARAELEAQQNAARPNSPAGENQLKPGKAAGTNAQIPRLDAAQGPGTRGSGEMAQGATQPAQTPQEGPQGFQTALFERRDETRSDARLARRAILNGWRPKPEATEAVMTKATVMALDEKAKLNEVIAVGKLHLDAHRTVVGDEHHGDRMDYYERAMRLREATSDVPGGAAAGMSMETDGKTTKVMVYLPNNSRADRDDDLRPEDLLLEDQIG